MRNAIFSYMNGKARKQDILKDQALFDIVEEAFSRTALLLGLKKSAGREKAG